MGSFSSVLSKPPQAFTFNVNGYEASVPAAEHQVQSIIDHFKSWFPLATLKLKETRNGVLLGTKPRERTNCAKSEKPKRKGFGCDAT